MHDQKVSILGFEKAALLSISHETTQAEVDAGILEKIACARILQRPPKEKGGKRGLLHIVTLGCHRAWLSFSTSTIGAGVTIFLC